MYHDFALEVSGLTKTFDRPAVNNLNLKVKAGEFYALLGPNGAGKTTSLRMVAGLLSTGCGKYPGIWAGCKTRSCFRETDHGMGAG